MSLKSWLNKKMAIISLAMASVEKNSLSQLGDSTQAVTIKVKRNNQGTLADSLKQGEITQEVLDMRWRTYKVLRETESMSSEITGYDENNMPIVKTIKRTKKAGLSKVKVDNEDSYPLEIVLDNSEIVTSGNGAMDNEYISIFDEVDKKQNEEGEDVVSHGEISSNEFFATNKTEKPIIIGRDFIPKFEIETYTKKLNIRKINDSERLLEFYVSVYPDEYNRTSRLFISEVKKAIVDPSKIDMLTFSKVNFVTYKTMGANDFLEYQYENIKFDKIVEFNGHYVIKFTANIIIDGLDIIEGFRQTNLDEKYNNKEKK